MYFFNPTVVFTKLYCNSVISVFYASLFLPSDLKGFSIHVLLQRDCLSQRYFWALGCRVGGQAEEMGGEKADVSRDAKLIYTTKSRERKKCLAG